MNWIIPILSTKSSESMTTCTRNVAWPSTLKKNGKRSWEIWRRTWVNSKNNCSPGITTLKIQLILKALAKKFRNYKRRKNVYRVNGSSNCAGCLKSSMIAMSTKYQHNSKVYKINMTRLWLCLPIYRIELLRHHLQDLHFHWWNLRNLSNHSKTQPLKQKAKIYNWFAGLKVEVKKWI